MSDFDSAVVAAMLKAREIGVQMLASDCEAILQAAKQSMQGEAVYLVIDHDTLWRQVGKSEYDRAEENNRMLTFTHAPDSAARIAEQDAEIARLKMAIEYDQADDDAEWEPPHPIFQLAQERDNFMNRAIELQKELEEARKDAERYRVARAGIAVSGFCIVQYVGGKLIYIGVDVADSYIDAAIRHIDASLNIKGGAE